MIQCTFTIMPQIYELIHQWWRLQAEIVLEMLGLSNRKIKPLYHITPWMKNDNSWRMDVHFWPRTNLVITMNMKRWDGGGLRHLSMMLKKNNTTQLKWVSRKLRRKRNMFVFLAKYTVATRTLLKLKTREEKSLNTFYEGHNKNYILLFWTDSKLKMNAIDCSAGPDWAEFWIEGVHINGSSL